LGTRARQSEGEKNESDTPTTTAFDLIFGGPEALDSFPPPRVWLFFVGKFVVSLATKKAQKNECVVVSFYIERAEQYYYR
jgi:hypothetical protein|tara:strand:+ start:249 stop:488 length:240 start_codon:yes stop_codon:yes gene_type:complete